MKILKKFFSFFIFKAFLSSLFAQKKVSIECCKLRYNIILKNVDVDVGGGSQRLSEFEFRRGDIVGEKYNVLCELKGKEVNITHGTSKWASLYFKRGFLYYSMTFLILFSLGVVIGIIAGFFSKWRRPEPGSTSTFFSFMGSSC